MHAAEPARGLRCSFCGKREDEVESMVAGRWGVAICNECVDLCAEIIAEQRARAEPGGCRDSASSPQPSHGSL